MKTRFIRRIALPTLALAISGLLLSACGGSDDPAPAPQATNPTPSTPTTTPTTPATGGTGTGTGTTPTSPTTPTSTTPAPTSTTPTPTSTTPSNPTTSQPNPTGTTPTPTPTTPPPVVVSHSTQPALEAATQFMAQFDQLVDTIPTVANATTYLSNTDSCYLFDGRNKAANIANIDGDLSAWRERNKHLIGSRRSNIVVTSDDTSTNADGSTRRRIGISYRITYADGLVSNDETISFISGSSQGTCATPTNSTTWRFLGNQRIVGITVRSRNEFQATLSRVDGSDINSRFRREVQYLISDPQQTGTYAIVTSPVTVNFNGVVGTLSMKMVAAHVMKSAPEMAGKRGNYTNYTADDVYSVCTVNSNGAFGFANQADCTQFGAQGVGIGVNLTIPSASPSLSLNDTRIATADNNFNSIGYAKGTTATIAIYNDDGWKTVNGQVGKTPIATYTVALGEIPYTFAQLYAGGTSTFAYASTTDSKLNGVTGTGPGIASVLASGAAGTLGATWTGVVSPDSRAFRLASIFEGFEGAASNSNFWPQLTITNTSYPGGTATTANFPITALPANMVSKNFTQFTLNYSDRKNNQIRSRIVFQ